MQKKQSELTVITKAKDLCTYVMTVTQKSLKQYRYTFVSKGKNKKESNYGNFQM